MQGWKEKLLSQVGKEIMIKAVIQSIPAYSMSVFKLPVSLCKDIEMMIRKLWWGQGETKKIHWVKWSTLCSSKSIGGMGFRDIQNFNMAMLAKQVWRFLNNRDSLLFKVFSSKYFPEGNILDIPIPSKCSYALRSILQSRDVIHKGDVWRVGDGQKIDIWSHRWLPDVGQSKVISPRNDTDAGKVCDLFYPNSKLWDPGLIQHMFHPWEAEKILKIHVNEVSSEDMLVWPLSPDGDYSVKTAYILLAIEVMNGLPSSSGGACSLLWKRIWKIHAPQRIKHFIWRAATDYLPTKQNLAR